MKWKNLLSVVLSLFVCFGLVSSASAGLIAHWKFDDTLLDATGNDHDGSMKGGGSSGYVPGVFGKAIDLTPNSAVEVPHDAALSLPNAYTVAGWVKFDAATGDPFQGFVTKGDWDEEYSIIGGPTRTFANGNRTSGIKVESVTTAVVGTWYHVALTFDTTNGRKMYVGGDLEASNPDTTPAFVDAATPVLIGAEWDAFSSNPLQSPRWWIDGQLDDVALWNEPLELWQVRNAMNYGAENYLVPEPSTLTLLVLGGLMGWLVLRRRRP